jgi:hypothetical protein
MGNGAISRLNDFQEGMGVRSTTLEFDSNGREEDNLDSGAAGIPERT